MHDYLDPVKDLRNDEHLVFDMHKLHVTAQHLETISALYAQLASAANEKLILISHIRNISNSESEEHTHDDDETEDEIEVVECTDECKTLDEQFGGHAHMPTGEPYQTNSELGGEACYNEDCTEEHAEEHALQTHEKE